MRDTALYYPAMAKKKQKTAVPEKSSLIPQREIMAVLVIIAVGVVVYGRCVTYDYVLYDDPNVIFQNPRVLNGPTPANIFWAFTNPNFGLYHPLPTISYMIDRMFFRDWTGGYHAVTLFWHLLCASTLFIVLLRLFGNYAVALVTALLFAVHPVQAMTVNWIVARNEIMVTFFMLLCIEFYRQYVLKRDVRSRIFSLLFMVLAMMCKQGIVLLPAVLLILDYWPLRRIQLDFKNIPETLKTGVMLSIEKIPWVAVSGIGIFFAFFGKMQFNILDKNSLMSPLDNFGFAFTAYIRYLFYLIYPVNYVTAYSTETEWLTVWMAAGAFVILITITALALAFYKRRPYFLLGWTWFVLLMLPVSGLVRYNSESIALRYLYAPVIGLCLLVAFALLDVFTREKEHGNSFDASNMPVPLGYKAVSAMFVVLLAVICFWQSGFWKNSEILAQRALAVTNNTNAIAHNHLAEISLRRGLLQQAEVHMRRAMELEPKIKAYTYNYAVLLMRQKRYQEALELLAPIVEESGHLASITSQYGAALLALERLDEAQEYLEKAVQIEPDFVPALFNLAFCYFKKNEPDKAVKYLNRVLELQPDHASAKALLEQLK